MSGKDIEKMLEKVNELEANGKIGVFDYSTNKFYECKYGYHIETFSKILRFRSIFEMAKAIQEEIVNPSIIENKLNDVEFLGETSVSSSKSSVMDMIGDYK